MLDPRGAHLVRILFEEELCSLETRIAGQHSKLCLLATVRKSAFCMDTSDHRVETRQISLKRRQTPGTWRGLCRNLLVLWVRSGMHEGKSKKMIIVTKRGIMAFIYDFHAGNKLAVTVETGFMDVNSGSSRKWVDIHHTSNMLQLSCQSCCGDCIGAVSWLAISKEDVCLWHSETGHLSPDLQNKGTSWAQVT